ncbi:MAG TPA: PIG-L family deacetylase [Bacteroidia bacterium]|nr:PIG-L family deacetylase [Bacteroidia bacterium]
MNKKIVIALVTLLSICTTGFAQGPLADKWDAAKIQLELSKLNTLGCVMYIAAHPDDENTRLLTYLANERLFRTVYVSLTRGDGGQNLLGDQQGEELGLIRTQELLAARRIDGAEQFFTSAIDFGYSKNPEETFTKWDKDRVLGDLVWAIRRFRPDVIITRFPDIGDGGHGHHTASAILAFEAFKAAGDPSRFKEQLKLTTVWQPKRIYFNSFIRRGQPVPDYYGQLKLDVGGYNPLIGLSYGEIAAESRSMHKSQGFGVASTRGTQIEYFKPLAGDTTVRELLGGLNPCFARLSNSEEAQKWTNDAIENFNPLHPEYSVDALIHLYHALDSLSDAYWKNQKKEAVLKLIIACSGIYAEATVNRFNLYPGATVPAEVSIISRLADHVSLTAIALSGADTTFNAPLKRNESLNWETTLTVQQNAAYSEPYWLSGPPSGLMYPGSRELSGTPENKPALTALIKLNIDATAIEFTVPVTYKETDPVKGEIYRKAEILPKLSVAPADPVLIFTGNKTQKLKASVTSNCDSASGRIHLQLPKGWTAKPEYYDFGITEMNGQYNCEFEVFPPVTNGSVATAVNEALLIVDSDHQTFTSGIRRIEYDHIPPQFHLREAAVRLITMDLNTKAHTIGYLEGAGDDVAECLTRAGFTVEMLDDEILSGDGLQKYDAIITGIRAYNTNDKIGSYQEQLLRYVNNGGTLVVQYNTSNFLGTVKSDVGPYPFKISRDRVTDENATVRFIDPKSKLLNEPNVITAADFNGWVQERGLYFASDADPKYSPLFSMNDANEPPLTGSVISAHYGKGIFIYTGLSFFRQLPAGVPGAYRLLTNFINAGK